MLAAGIVVAQGRAREGFSVKSARFRYGRVLEYRSTAGEVPNEQGCLKGLSVGRPYKYGRNFVRAQMIAKQSFFVTV